MSNDFAPRVFEFGKPAVCLQPITFEGREFKPGEVFPYAELGLDKYRMIGFFQAMLVKFTDDAPTAATVAAKPAQSQRHAQRR